MKGAIKFTSPYGGTSVYRSVGSSVTFSWSFSGGVGTVNWGVKVPNINDIDSTPLVSLSSTSGVLSVTTEDPYSGRVNGSYSGDASSGQAIFTLSNIRKGDKGFYGCKITSTFIIPVTKFDFVELISGGG